MQPVDALVEAWQSVDAACADLSEEAWKTATALPGWSVQDVVSHLIGVELLIAGDPAPPYRPGERAPHVRNVAGEVNETAVAMRRDRAGAEVLAEFREVVARRVAALGPLVPDDLARNLPPGGMVSTWGEALQFRLTDTWIHDKDIRRALGQECDWSGHAANGVWAWLASRLPGMVTADVRFAVEGRAPFAIGTGTDATLTMSFPTFVLLCCGRLRPDEAPIDVTGSRHAADIALEGVNVMLRLESLVPAYGEEIAQV